LTAALAAIIASAWTSVAQDSSARAKLNHDPDAAKLVTSENQVITPFGVNAPAVRKNRFLISSDKASKKSEGV